MKIFFNLLKTGLYVIIILVILDVIFWLFQLLTGEILQGLAYLQLHMAYFIFLTLFIFVGLLIISLIYGLFQVVSMFLVSFVTKLCPYKQFASWYVLVVSFLFAALFIYNIWTEYGFPSIVIGLTSIALTILALSLARGLVLANDKFFKEDHTVKEDKWDYLQKQKDEAYALLKKDQSLNSQ